MTGPIIYKEVDISVNGAPNGHFYNILDTPHGCWRIADINVLCRLNDDHALALANNRWVNAKVGELNFQFNQPGDIFLSLPVHQNLDHSGSRSFDQDKEFEWAFRGNNNQVHVGSKREWIAVDQVVQTRSVRIHFRDWINQNLGTTSNYSVSVLFKLEDVEEPV